jgi:hypothetical protein
MYIGKKQFRTKNARVIAGRKNKKITYIYSGWKEYTGSSKELNKDIEEQGKQDFKFEILSVWNFKSSLWYEEIRMIVLLGAMKYPELYYNGQLSGMKFRPKLDVPIINQNVEME